MPFGFVQSEHVARAREQFARAFYHLDRIAARPQMDCAQLFRRYEAGLVAVQRAVNELEAARRHPRTLTASIGTTHVDYSRLEILARNARERLYARCFKESNAIDEPYMPRLEGRRRYRHWWEK